MGVSVGTPGGEIRWSVGKILEKWSLARPEKSALIIDGDETTYAELNAKSNEFVHLFARLGLKRGDRVAGLTLNCVEVVALYFACAKYGLICIPLNNRLMARELAYQINDSGVSLIVFEPAFADELQEAMRLTEVPASHVLAIGDLPERGAWYTPLTEALVGLSKENPVLDDSPILDDPLAIIYTSGTTGAPKGAVTTHLQTFFKCMQVIIYTDMREDDVYLTHAPLFHSAGLFMALTPAILHGCTLVTAAKFDPRRMIDDAKKYKATLSGGASTMLKMVLAEYDPAEKAFEHIRIFIGGGERTALSLIEEIKEKTGATLQMMYGQTENSFMTLLDKDDVFAKHGSAGRPGLATDVWIEDDQGNALPPGQTGNIVARGPTVMSGYWNLPEKTAETLIGDKLITGDMGYKDDSGNVYLVDRQKDMYRSGAENVYPAEIEKLLMDHPDVQNAAIIGVADEKWGEVGKAFLVLRPGQTVTPEELLSYLEGKLARYKYPKHFEFLDELPMTESGKVKKITLKEREGDAAKLEYK